MASRDRMSDSEQIESMARIIAERDMPIKRADDYIQRVIDGGNFSVGANPRSIRMRIMQRSSEIYQNMQKRGTSAGGGH